MPPGPDSPASMPRMRKTRRSGAPKRSATRLDRMPASTRMAPSRIERLTVSSRAMNRRRRTEAGRTEMAYISRLPLWLMRSSWPRLSRLHVFLLDRLLKTWMPGTGPGTTSLPSSALAADAGDVGAAAGELVFQPLEAAVEVVDAVDHGLALGRKAGDDQRDRRAQIGRHHGRAPQPFDAFDRRGFAVKVNARPEPGELLHVHEAVLEDGLGDARGAFGACH